MLLSVVHQESRQQKKCQPVQYGAGGSQTKGQHLELGAERWLMCLNLQHALHLSIPDVRLPLVHLLSINLQLNTVMSFMICMFPNNQC